MSKRNILNPANLVDNKVAGNGLLDRRMLLRGGLFSAGIVSAKASDITPDWMKVPGRSFSPYGMPSKWQEKVQRTFAVLPDRAGTGSSRTPLHLMEGSITPNGLHFERHHNGICGRDSRT